MNKTELRAIWEEVKTNHARLASCPGPHKFPPYVREPRERYTCETCNGSLDATDRLMYDRGLAHGALICGAKLTWTQGEDGFESTCPTCGEHLLGLLSAPESFPICMARRKS